MNIIHNVVIFIIVSIWSTSATEFSCQTSENSTEAAARDIPPWMRWPNAVAKFELHDSLSASDLVQVRNAFDEYHSKTCIRFQPRSTNEESYVRIQRDDSVCGAADVCRTGGLQTARFGGSCARSSVMVHELGHTLCFGHEESRPDRDDFVQFNDCPPPEKYGDDYDLLGQFYDYRSQMHSTCGTCSGGWPKMSGVTRCGMDVTSGLSVMDADKINQFYNCKGCYRHRWVRREDFTDADIRSMPVYGGSIDNRSVFLCRAYVGGEMTPGKYRLDYNVCYVGYNGVEYGARTGIQIFTIPSGEDEVIRDFHIWYMVNRITPAALYNEKNFTPVGTTDSGVTIYATRATIFRGGAAEVAPGKVYASNLSEALIPFNGRELTVTEFEILGCTDF